MKLLSFTLSFLLLVQSASIGVGDILRVNELINHAQFHQQEYGDSLFVFVSKHYGELKKDHMENNPSEQNDHEKLPFGHTSCQHHFAQVFLLQQTDTSLGNIEILKDSEGNFRYKEPSSSSYKSGIFQPPKYA